MGSLIARTFVERGYRTTVCNRTASRSAPLGAAGATAAAMAASPRLPTRRHGGGRGTGVRRCRGRGQGAGEPHQRLTRPGRAERVAGSLAAHPPLLPRSPKRLRAGNTHRISVRSASRSR
ncbi:hypothetical protein [Actinomadura miaoliensis]|uniref:hypothetical protein n=1 Tax=Actinomadura miaoliensis TaxID=430685 RepID=UPI0031EDDFCA